jgi:hypothetical protein
MAAASTDASATLQPAVLVTQFLQACRLTVRSAAFRACLQLNAESADVLRFPPTPKLAKLIGAVDDHEGRSLGMARYWCPTRRRRLATTCSELALVISATTTEFSNPLKLWNVVALIRASPRKKACFSRRYPRSSSENV